MAGAFRYGPSAASVSGFTIINHPCNGEAAEYVFGNFDTRPSRCDYLKILGDIPERQVEVFRESQEFNSGEHGGYPFHTLKVGLIWDFASRLPTKPLRWFPGTRDFSNDIVEEFRGVGKIMVPIMEPALAARREQTPSFEVIATSLFETLAFGAYLMRGEIDVPSIVLSHFDVTFDY